MSSPFGVYILKLTTYDVEKREQTKRQLLSLIPLFLSAPGLGLRLAPLLKNKQEKNQNGRLY